MIIVTGASGSLGGRIVRALLEVTHDSVVASVRDPNKAADLTALGVEVRRGDFGQPETLAAAFEGATQVLLVSSNAQASGGDPLQQHHSAIHAAKAAGARRILYTSHMGASAGSAFSPMRTHAATEELLRDSGLDWTSLRNGFYASTIPMVVGEGAVFNTPPDGKVAWTAHADLAAAAAQVLVQEGRFEGPTPPLTAAQALDFDEIAQLLSQQRGRVVEHQVVADERFAAELATRQFPSNAVQLLLEMFRAARAGEFAAVDPTLGELLGRAPLTLAQALSTRLA